MVQKISEDYLRTEVFGHIGFEAKQEMKPCYNIVHKVFQMSILRKLGQFFFKIESPMWVIIQNTECSDIHVAENQHK